VAHESGDLAALTEISEALALELDSAQLAQLSAYASLLFKWRSITNLTAAKNTLQFVREHVVDCLAVVPFVNARRLLDVGSGAGLPAIVLAIACPNLHVTALEPRARRARFLTQSKIELGLDTVEVCCARVEAHKPSEPYDVVISRAFSSLEQFVLLTEDLHGPRTRIVAMKGAVNAVDLAAAEQLAGPGQVVALDVPGFEHRNLVIFEPGRPRQGAAGQT
jgi:16S rRNA (guanine527-N7)-methyltransferase